MTPVSLEHIRQLQDLLLRMRRYIEKGEKQKAEQLGHDHMSLTSKGHKFLEEYADGIELEAGEAYRLVHRHFRDLTYNYLAGHTTQTAADVLAAFDEQLVRYSQFLAEHTPVVAREQEENEAGLELAKKECDVVVAEIIVVLNRIGRNDLVERWELAVKAIDDARQNVEANEL